jgi:sulfur transfer complex TusBCD TusB component (DsrH family)
MKMRKQRKTDIHRRATWIREELVKAALASSPHPSIPLQARLEDLIARGLEAEGHSVASPGV